MCNIIPNIDILHILYSLLYIMLYDVLYNYTKQYHFIFLLRLLGHYFVFLYFIFNFIILFLISMQLKRFPGAFSGTVSVS